MSVHTPAPLNTVIRTYNITVDDAQAKIEGGGAVLIDVREPFERAAAYIPGSHAAPLSLFDAAAILESYPEKQIIFHCKSGSRSAEAAKRYAQATGAAETWLLTGGIDAWRAAGLPVDRSDHAPKLDIMRQVQMIAGSLVLIGTLLGAFVHPAFLILTGFVGGGLFFAGATGWCGMALLLGRLPWNRLPGEPSKVACVTGSSCCSR